MKGKEQLLQLIVEKTLSGRIKWSGNSANFKNLNLHINFFTHHGISGGGISIYGCHFFGKYLNMEISCNDSENIKQNLLELANIIKSNEITESLNNLEKLINIFK